MTNRTNNSEQQPAELDLAAIRERLAAGGKEHAWRSLNQLAENETFLEFLHNEFPRQASLAKDLSRRDFLKLMAASLSLAGLASCVPQSSERIMPYSQQPPEELVPGRPLFFATAMELDGYARGLLVENHMGRPTKVEGNPDHPASLGATDVFAQASVLNLYDPERARAITSGGQIRSWSDFQVALAQALQAQAGGQGAGLRILTGAVTSPTLASQLNALLEAYPNARWHQYDPVARDNVLEGALLAFGEPVEIRYRFDRANVVLSLDNNFILHEPGNLRYIREFTDRRRVLEGQAEMNRLYVVESTLSNVGGFADHRLPVTAAQVGLVARELAASLGVEAGPAGEASPAPDGWVAALAADLQANQGASLILAGPQQPPEVHALALAMNAALGNIGQTVLITDPVQANPVNHNNSLADLAAGLQAGEVEVLVVLGGSNPVFTAPVDLDFAQAYAQAGFSVYLGLYADETAAVSTWHIPAAHYLEMWSDTRAFDGTVSIVQPLIEPLYGGRSPHELLAEMLGQTGATGYEIVRQFWQTELGAAGDFDLFWQQALYAGMLPDSALPERQANVNPDLAGLFSDAPAADSNSLEIVFEPDPSIWDGRFANNAWLQELPRPITKLTWDNAAMISPNTAERLELSNEDVVELHYAGRSVTAPVWVLPGQPDNSVTVHLGYGRSQGGEVQQGAGFNAYALRTSQAPWFASGLEIRKTGRRYPLATTQDHHQMEERDPVRFGDLTQFREDPTFLQHGEGPHTEGEQGVGELGEAPPPSLYPEWPYEGHAWGMAINLNTCIGCNACVIACQAENNIPVVGKEQVLNAREMHWLRVDSYYNGDLENPDVFFQPLPCMHCEKAPCEPVCPVAATTHSAEGINEMTYNRCIGTRYCSNNCPYKVRRFNFLQYSEDAIPLQMLHNPEVTVRSRGVMEKCTYCVQRVNNARIQAKSEGRPIADGEVVTACAQACPAQAIVFGDINDPTSQVHQLKEQPHNYALLGELGTQPRTTYLGKLRNPNPDMPAGV